MNFFNLLFNNKSVTCPRCLGKGHVDWDDIKRLHKELKWRPGQCAYCNAKGVVNAKLLDKVPVDRTYLTVDLSHDELKKVMNNDAEALERGASLEKNAEAFIKQVRILHYEANMSPEKIASFFLIPEENITEHDKNELLDYIIRILQHKSNLN